MSSTSSQRTRRITIPSKTGLTDDIAEPESTYSFAAVRASWGTCTEKTTMLNCLSSTIP
jgi:hypothetical protein